MSFLLFLVCSLNRKKLLSVVSDVDHCSGHVLVYLEQVTEGSEMLLHLLGAEVVGALHQEPHAVDGDDAHDQEADGAELDTEQEPESGPGPVYTQNRFDTTAENYHTTIDCIRDLE